MLSQEHPSVVTLSFGGGVYEVFKAHLLIAGECIEACSASECRAKELNIVEESRSHLRFLALCICAVEHRIEILNDSNIAVGYKDKTDFPSFQI
jgi:hypothetical protein